eukprot:g19737.t1
MKKKRPGGGKKKPGTCGGPLEEPDIDIIIDNPLPSHFCEACGEEIWVGHITSESLQQRFDTTLQWHKLSCS